jgi:arylsulfatase A-like enzyme
MQSAVPELSDISGESETTRKLYGLDDAETEEYGRSCLMARRLVERGVRFVELLSPKRDGEDRWDQHAHLKRGHMRNAKAADKPIAALLTDLKARGLLNDTLVIWTGEFGRSPTVQGSGEAVGRDHHPYGFSMWMAGAGVNAGSTFGATDEYGYYAIENRVHVHDLHATILHLLGLEHTRLTYPFSGREMRLTDVHGRVVRGILG